MALTTSPATFTFRDSQGREARTTFFILVDTSVPSDYTINIGNLLTPLTNCSNAFIQTYTSGPPVEIGYGTNAQYAAAQDKMVLLFQDTLGAKHRFAIPAPKLANFAADGLTVLNTGVSGALVTAIIAYTVTRNNLALLYLSGWYAKARNLKRTSSLVKTPAGTGQAVP